jgi:hypothetical protein
MGGWGRITRRRALAIAMASLAALPSSVARAASVAVPLSLQVDLLLKVLVYDRNLRARAVGVLRMLVVVRRDDPASVTAAGAIEHRLDSVESVGGMLVRRERVSFTNAKELAVIVRERRASCVYLMPGLSTEIENIRDALSGIDTVSVSAVPEDVSHGIVLGFDQASGKPKILVNLPQALKQKVHFAADLLRIATVLR